MVTCEAYRDTWRPFFELLRRFWPDCKYPVSVVTDWCWNRQDAPSDVQVLRYEDDWCGNLVQFANDYPSDPILMLLDDFWINAPVNTELIQRGLEQMEKTKSGCVRLYPCPGPDEEYGDPHFGIVSPGARYRISTQAALWRPSYLRQIAEQYKTPWEFELDGSAFSDSLPDPVLAFRRDIHPWPVSYYGAVRHGQWAPAVKPFMESMGIDVDWNRRSFQAA